MKYCEDCKEPRPVAGICKTCSMSLCDTHYSEHSNHCPGQRESGNHGYSRTVPDLSH
jgi:hypothetical protein